MSITYDAPSTATNTSTTSLTWAHTCTGSNRGLSVGVEGEGADLITGVTYNGVAMTLVDKEQRPAGKFLYAYYLNAPAAGTHDVVVTGASTMSIRGVATSHAGVKQTGQPVATNKTSGSGIGSLAVPVTTLADNSWVVGFFESNQILTAGASTTLRVASAVAVLGAFDSNGAVTPAGIRNLTATISPAANTVGIAYALEPAPVDATLPTQTGSLVASAITSTGYTLTWPAGADNVAVTSYERSLDGGSTWADVGNVLTVNITGRTPGSTDNCQVRAKDAAGNVSTPVLSATVNLAASLTKKGLNFRLSPGYVTDGTDETYVLGNETTPTSRGWVTNLVWSSNISGNSRDRATAYGANLAGINGVGNAGGVTQTCTFDLPNGPRTYKIHLALGDFSSSQNTKLVIKDGATTLATINGTTLGAEFLDAAGVVQAAAAWAGGNAEIQLTFAGSTCALQLGGHASATFSSTINHISLEPVAGDTTGPVITGPSGATGSTSSKSIAENTTAVHTFSANEAVTWSLNGGADVALFAIDPSTGALSFNSAPNFEAAADADTNNTYVVGVRATDGASNATTQTCTVTVTDVVEGDATAPVLTGSLVSSAITSTGYTLTWPAGSDNTAVTSYERSLDGGSTWVDVGNVLTVNISGRTPSTTDNCRVRAKDAAGNVSTPALAVAVNLLAPSTPTITSEVLKDNLGNVLASVALSHYSVYNDTTGALVVRKTGLSTNGSGVVSFTDGALVSGTMYRHDWETAAGNRRMPRKAAA